MREKFFKIIGNFKSKMKIIKKKKNFIAKQSNLTGMHLCV